jgi:predicted PurR-regulated permease PerM
VPILLDADGKTDYKLLLRFPNKTNFVFYSLLPMTILTLVFVVIILLTYTSALKQLIMQKQISEILQESVESILSQDNQVFNFNNSSIDRFYAYIENLQEDNKEILKNSIALLNNQLEHMRNENMKLIDIIAKK